MSLAVLADHLASKGRNGDSMLVHMTPEEVKGLHALAVTQGDGLTINPETGLPEANILKRLLPTIIGAGISFFSGGTIDPMTAAMIVGGAETARTGDLGKGIAAGFGAYGGANLTSAFASAGTTAGIESAVAAGAPAVSEAEIARLMLETGADKEVIIRQLQREALEKATAEAATRGFGDRAMLGLEGLKSEAGRGRFMEAAGGLSGLAKAGYMSAAPILAGSMVPTTTSMPSSRPGDTGYVRSFQFDPRTQGLQYLGAVPANQIRPSPVNRAPAPAPAPAPYEQPPEGYADGGMIDDPYAFSQRSEPVVRMAPGGLASFANGGALTPEIARSLMQRSMTTGVPTSEFDKYGGYQAVSDLYRQQGGSFSLADIPKTDLQKYAEQVADTGVGNLLALKETGTPLGLEGLIGMSQNEIGRETIQNAINQFGLEGFTPTGDYTGLQGRYTTLEQQNAALQRQIAELQGRLKPATTTPGGVPPIFTTSQTTIPGTSSTNTTYGGGALNQQQNAGVGSAGSGYRGSETMAQLRDEYTRGGGRLGMPNIVTPEPVVAGGSKQAYDYLMGRGAYPVAPFTPTGTPLMRPYTDILESSGRPAGPTITLPKRPERSTALGADTGVDTGESKSTDFGFTPPAKGDIVTQAIQRWRNRETGEVFLAPTGGYKPPGPNWELDTGGFAKGGLSAIAAAGAASGGNVEHYNLGGYSDGGRLLRGPGDGVSDSIPATIGGKRPARLADGEFVVPARIVSEIGNGSTEAGARKLYAMMDRVQRARAKTTGKGKVAKNTKAEKYLPA